MLGPPTVVVIPIYNDWNAVSLLLPRLDAVAAAAGLSLQTLLVDDGSTEAASAALGGYSYRAIRQIDVLRLRRNLGHQRAIAVGLAYAADKLGTGAVLIMDGDGEDAPEDVPRLIARLAESGGTNVIFAERTRRSENLPFRISYGVYRYAHWFLTGIAIRVGNFSVIPREQLNGLVVVSELWNHYAAAVFKARLPREAIATTRAKRLHGQPRMNFVSLIGHGLSALSVHAELIGVRLLVVTIGAVTLLAVALAGVLAVRLSTSLAIPGWATTAAGLLLILLAQVMSFAACFAFLVLHGRSQPLFIPIRDYGYFVASVRTFFRADSQEPSPIASPSV